MTDAFRPKARRPRGFADRRGPQLAQEREIVETVLAVYQAWGFERLDTSAFEYADALGKFLPDQDRPNEGVFSLQDDDEQWMALRYDLTAPLARFVAEHFDGLPKPYRRCAAGPVWRNEKPGPGRFREFWQCDADTVGSASPAADAEMIAMACAALEALGLGGQYRLKVSTRTLLDGIMDRAGIVQPKQRLGVLRAVDKADKFSLADVRLLLGEGRKDESGDFTPGATLTNDQADAVLALLSIGADGGRAAALARIGGLPGGEAAAEALGAIDAVLCSLGVSDDQAIFDPSVVRGLEYYTGAVFEAELLLEMKDEDGRPARFGSVGGGGRYDDLVSRFKGQPIPATGFSIGVSRLAAALAMAQGQAAEASGPVVILAFDQADMADYFAMAQELRGAGVVAEVYLGSSGPKAQFKYADKRGAPIAVICGGDEKAKGEVAIKDLLAGAKLGDAAADREAYQAARDAVQITVPRADLVAAVKAMRERQG
jgi:histidyl-tRNA synthetase